jgi:hypothetical protein
VERRTFLKTMGAAVAWSALIRGGFQAVRPPAVRFGVDMFSVNRQGWTPFQMLDWAGRWGVKVVHFSEVGLIGGLDSDRATARGRRSKHPLDQSLPGKAVGNREEARLARRRDL